jgi:hypothetical protein
MADAEMHRIPAPSPTISQRIKASLKRRLAWLHPKPTALPVKPA